MLTDTTIEIRGKGKRYAELGAACWVQRCHSFSPQGKGQALRVLSLADMSDSGLQGKGES